MLLYIAEKPSLGRAIAAVLSKPQERGDGYIRAANGDVVSWCVGHLLEQAEPDAYDPAFKKWSHEHLPIVPDVWQLQVRQQSAKQLGVLRKLMPKADGIVHAGDPDREGQLLVDEVIHFLGHNPKSAKRLLINDLNPSAVRTALGKLRDNREFAPLSASALARSRADWLYGINLTRAYTLQGQKVNYQGVLSVGRVQTPILGLVARRDLEIEQFVSKPFYEVWANLETLPDAGSEPFRARWLPSKTCQRFLDDQGRNLSKALAENVAQRVSDAPATVTQVTRKKKRERPPLPHSLSSLQIDAARRFRLPAQRVLDIAQALYERHNLITYPRSDSRYLPAEQFGQARAVVDTIEHNLRIDTMAADASNLRQGIAQIDVTRRTKAWNDAKVDAHHAIIPTAKKAGALSADEARVYALICRNYLAQFLPDHEFADTEVQVDIGGGKFVARAREELAPGWRVLLGEPKRKGAPSAEKANASSGKDAARSGSQNSLPNLNKGQALLSRAAEVVERHTTPPEHFNDATLLTAITGIASFVQDPELKKVLRATDGLGTEATRAGIIELLFKRGFLTRSGKHIQASASGRGLIAALPESTTLPDMTARWEATMTAITQREASYESFMTPLIAEVSSLVRESVQCIPSALQGLSTPARRKWPSKGSNKNKNKNKNKSKRKPVSQRSTAAADPDTPKPRKRRTRRHKKD